MQIPCNPLECGGWASKLCSNLKASNIILPPKEIFQKEKRERANKICRERMREARKNG